MGASRYTPSLRTCLIVVCWSAIQTAAPAQVFVTGLGGVSALSGAAAAQANPPAASSYDPKIGAAFNVAAGYHINDWFSVQSGYIWNRNQVITSELAAGGILVQHSAVRGQSALGADLQLYFRPRTSWLRPYLSAGPAWVHILSQNKPGLRVAVGLRQIAPKGIHKPTRQARKAPCRRDDLCASGAARRSACTP